MLQINGNLFAVQLFLGHKQIIIIKKEWTYTLVFDQSSFNSTPNFINIVNKNIKIAL